MLLDAQVIPDPMMGVLLVVTSRSVPSKTVRTLSLVVVDERRDGQLMAAVGAGTAAAAALLNGRHLRAVCAWCRPDDHASMASADLLLVGQRVQRLVPVGSKTIVVTGLAREADLDVTGVDVLGFLLGGAVAVADVGVLSMAQVMSELAMAARAPRRVLVGVPARRFSDLYRKVIEDWPSDGHDELDEVCFRAALALAQLDRLHPATSGRRNFGWTAFATSLMGHSSRTAMIFAHGDLRRALGRLADLWSPGELLEEADLMHEPGALAFEARTMLPDLARNNGFPHRLPVVRGVDPIDVGRELFRLLTRIDITDEGDLSGVPCVRLRVDVDTMSH